MQDILVKAGCYIAIIILGYTLRQRGFFGENAFSVISSIVIKITLPAAIIASSSGRAIPPSMLTITALGFGGGVLYILVAAFLYRKQGKEKQAFAILNTPGYNIGTFAMPFTQSFLGPMGVVTTSLFDVGNAFVCLGGAYGIAAAVKAGEGFNGKRIFRTLSHSVPFLAHLMMVILNLLGWTLPTPVVSFAQIVGNGNAFMAMLMIGVGFQLSGEREQMGDIARILLTRYGIATILALVFYFVLPFQLEVRQALVILAFSPIGSAVPGFTAELKSDVGLSSAISSIAIVCSIVITVVLLVVML
jgi:predicted permease